MTNNYEIVVKTKRNDENVMKNDFPSPGFPPPPFPGLPPLHFPDLPALPYPGLPSLSPLSWPTASPLSRFAASPLSLPSASPLSWSSTFPVSPLCWSSAFPSLGLPPLPSPCLRPLLPLVFRLSPPWYFRPLGSRCVCVCKSKVKLISRGCERLREG